MSEPEPSLLDLPLTGAQPDGSDQSAQGAPPPRRGPRTALLIVLVALVAGVIGYLLPRPGPPVLRPEVEVVQLPDTRVGETAPEWSVELGNAGTRALRIEKISLEGEASDDVTLLGDSCTDDALSNQEMCLITLSFAPTRAGERQATLVVTSNDPGSPLRLPIEGLALEPRLTLEPNELRFAAALVGEAAQPARLLLTNSGNAPLAIATFHLEGEARSDFALAGDRCSRQTLDPTASCEVSVRFSPRAAGARTASLRIASDAAGNPHVVSLTGRGTAPRPTLLTEPDRLDFGPTRADGPPEVDKVTLRNGGTGRLSISAIRLDDSARAFALDTSACRGAVLRGEETCAVEVRFAPRTEGDFQARLRIASNDAGGERALRLAGKAVQARLVAEPAALDFGPVAVGASASQELRLRNRGSAAYEIGRLAYRGAAPEGVRLAGDSCSGARLEPGGECRLTLVFEPSEEGERSATLLVPDRSGGDGLAVRLSARGARGRLEARDGALSFGEVPVGETSRRSVTFTNSGEAPLAIREVSLEGSRDARIVADGCSSLHVLAPGAPCTVVVDVVPASREQIVATLVVRHDGSDSPGRVPVSATGARATAPLLELSPDRAELSTAAVGERSEIRTFTIRNLAQGRLRLDGITLSGRDREDFQIVPGTCSGVSFLGPGGSCTVGVRFVPSVAGAREARLTVAHGGSTEPVAARLDGTTPVPASDAG